MSIYHEFPVKLDGPYWELDRYAPDSVYRPDLICREAASKVFNLRGIERATVCLSNHRRAGAVRICVAPSRSNVYVTGLREKQYILPALQNELTYAGYPWPVWLWFEYDPKDRSTKEIPR